MLINGVEWIPKSSVVTKEKAKSMKGLEYCIVRTFLAGVFAGYLKEQNGKEGVVLNARRLWYWKGAASLSQLAVDGVSCPDECKFPCEVDEVRLSEIIEVIPCTEKARLCIASVKVWQA